MSGATSTPSMSYDSHRNPQNYEHINFNQSSYGQAMDAMERQEKICGAAGCEGDEHKCQDL